MNTRDPESQPPWLLAAAALGVVALAAAAAMLAFGLRWVGEQEEPVISQGSSAAEAGGGRTRDRSRTRRAVKTKRLFSSTSFWNKPLPENTPTDASSAAMVNALVAEVNREQQAGTGPWLATTRSSTPLYRAGPNQARVRVRLDPTGVPGARALARAFAKVPIPENAVPASGSDRHMTVWQPSTDRLWEFFGARRRKDGWHARWGGAIRRVSKNRGYYTEGAWPGATRNWGATASSLPVIGGTILAEELRAGRIRHALALNLPAARPGMFAWPAQRTDGTGTPTALPEGAQLRLDPQLNLRKLRLPKLTRMIATAAQRYGLVVRDQTGKGISLFAEDPAGLSKDKPFPGLFSSKTPAELLGRFPWQSLQVVRMQLCSAAPCPEP